MLQLYIYFDVSWLYLWLVWQLGLDLVCYPLSTEIWSFNTRVRGSCVIFFHHFYEKISVLWSSRTQDVRTSVWWRVYLFVRVSNRGKDRSVRCFHSKLIYFIFRMRAYCVLKCGFRWEQCSNLYKTDHCESSVTAHVMKYRRSVMGIDCIYR